MKNQTIWLDGVPESKLDSLTKDIDVDVLIIGAGLTGLSAAYHLRNSDLKVTVVDKGQVGRGITSRTTGKLTYLQELIYSKLSNNFPKELVQMYLDSQICSINMVRNIINDNKINCDFTEVSSYIFTDSESEISKIKKEKAILESMNIKTKEYKDISINNIEFKYAISVDNTAVFHPIKYLMAIRDICLKNNISIYENTCVTKIHNHKNSYTCFTPNGKIKCKKIVLACHYPFFLFPMFFPLKGHLERSYLSASPVDKTGNISAINTNNPSQSLRYQSNSKSSYFIYLNGSHTIENNIDEEKNFNKLKNKLNQLKLKPKYLWSNQDIITNDYLPYIGCVKSGDNTLLIGTGYNTWGMTNGSLAGKILSDIILEEENQYVPLFDPHRRKGVYDLISIPYNLYCSVKPFIENKLIKQKEWYPDNIKFINKNGNNLAIYTDFDGKKHIVYNKCPHMKCSLVFNETEKTWDCPCHGSRFNIDGKSIQGPSNYDISYNKN